MKAYVQSLKEATKSLEARVRALLPLAYHSCLDAVSPNSMGSAGLKYSEDGRVAWDEIWTSFCDLALAGGPPHRGSLLPPTNPIEARDNPERCNEVGSEIQRGIFLTTQMQALPGPNLGWVSLPCESEAMAAWLHRAIMAENVFTHRAGNKLHLPAAPSFQVAKEIKNVIVAVAKTFHYWDGHMSEAEQNKANRIMQDSTLLAPPMAEELLLKTYELANFANTTARMAGEALGLPIHPCEDFGWVGLACLDDKMAAWMARSAIAMNILARRQKHILYLPVIIPQANGDPSRVAEVLALLKQIWTAGRELGEA